MDYIYYNFILAIALILLAGRIGGELVERYLKQPRVLGEVITGIIISPFALGGLLGDPIVLNFAIIKGAYGLAEFSPLQIISELAIIILLFSAGVGTDFESFKRNILKGNSVSMGGIIVPFAFCFSVAMVAFYDVGLAGWLIIGAAFMATSIGITVRVFMDIGRMQTKSATIIMIAAVVDDIIAIIILSPILSIARGDSLDPFKTIVIIGTGFGAWFLLMFVGVRWSKYVSKLVLKPFKKSGTMPIVAIITGFLLSYLFTLVNLHPAVGAYLAGLLFAATAEKADIIEATEPIMLLLSPFFFVFLGMQVEIPLLLDGVIIIIVLLIVAVLGKFIGCYIPARLVGKLSNRGGMIVGIGMVPRGEICMIIIGAGLLVGAVTREIFSVVLAVNIITILITPLMLKLVIRKLSPPSTEAPVARRRPVTVKVP